MTTHFVGAEHEFHSREFSRGWAEKFVPTPERVRLFDLIFSQLNEVIPTKGQIIELGMGPGFLAAHLLKRLPGVHYCGIDFSFPMLEIAQERLRSYSSQVTYVQADLVKEAWGEMVSEPAHAIVSTWALHDLGSPENTKSVYEHSYHALVDGGILVNGDFIKPVEAAQEFEGGRFLVETHLELLDKAGFSNASCLSIFEHELQNPTAAQNYACIVAEK